MKKLSYTLAGFVFSAQNALASGNPFDTAATKSKTIVETYLIGKFIPILLLVVWATFFYEAWSARRFDVGKFVIYLVGSIVAVGIQGFVNHFLL
ncbi:MAG: hypothetical protein J0G32_03780 [Alphaproteobacteria bacterium]|jgi:hypothetical protein|nr:hypothetical protein [Alphaproteobacteria bacterium]OJV12549.1 MAG: hypothetical protein BGO27_03395 [Alphaproteobacteria bacterium 33-17]